MRRISRVFVLAALFFAALFLLPSCGQKSQESGQIGTTEKVYSVAQVREIFPDAYCGDSAYAQVDSRTLSSFYDAYRQQMFNEGVVRWDDRFDCNHFASYYVDLAQVRFYLSHFQSWTKAQTLAVGTFWYLQGGKAGRGHAIVVALTEKGVIFIEPQTGREVRLSAEEVDSRFLVVF